MKEILEIPLRIAGLFVFLSAAFRYASFYYLHFRCSENSNKGKFQVYIGPTRFTSKVFSKIDFDVSPKFQFLKRMSDFSLYLTIIGMVLLIVFATVQAFV